METRRQKKTVQYLNFFIGVCQRVSPLRESKEDLLRKKMAATQGFFGGCRLN